MNDEDKFECGSCRNQARWSICNLEGERMDPIVRALACGRHLHCALVDMRWDMDCVHVYDLAEVSE